MTTLDDATRQLVQIAGVVTVAEEDAIRAHLAAALSVVPSPWIEEVLLQTYLFAGFPRALNATREWRRVSGREPPRDAEAVSDDGDLIATWRARGEQTCALVYDGMYERLRMNVRQLHPALDDWMVIEGYGKVLSRPGLDLARRELCIVASCAAAGQERQLLSHLHGALNVGVAADVVAAAIDALAGVVEANHVRAAHMLYARVRGK